MEAKQNYKKKTYLESLPDYVGEIKKEKRRRLQAYTAISFMLSENTFFDFFSADLKEIFLTLDEIEANFSFQKDFLQQLSLGEVILAFIKAKSSLQNVLMRYGITEESWSKAIGAKNRSSKSVANFIFTNKNLNSSSCFEKPFSEEVCALMKSCAVKATETYKTPVITPEIFFLSIMDFSSSVFSRLLKKIVGSKENWYSLRYELVRYIYFEEINLRRSVDRSQRAFGYLLKSRLPHLELFRLIKKKALRATVKCFRTALVRKAAHEDILNKIEKDILLSARCNKRKYL